MSEIKIIFFADLVGKPGRFVMSQMCRMLRADTGIKQVVLSGGVFQNRLLFRMTTEALQLAGFQVLTHRLVPCNDGGISLGQAAVAHFATL